MLVLDPLREAVTLALYTGYVKDVRPASLIVIANPESGKTEMFKKFAVNKNVAYLTDATAFGIERDYFRQIESGEIRHIIIPDLLKPLPRKFAAWPVPVIPCPSRHQSRGSAPRKLRFSYVQLSPGLNPLLHCYLRLKHLALLK